MDTQTEEIEELGIDVKLDSADIRSIFSTILNMKDAYLDISSSAFRVYNEYSDRLERLKGINYLSEEEKAKAKAYILKCMQDSENKAFTDIVVAMKIHLQTLNNNPLLK
jgi:hypothetical protein